MSKIHIFFICLISNFSFGIEIEKILSQSRQKVERIECVESDNVTFILSDFANPRIQTSKVISKLKKLEITKMYYVYTSYKRSKSFDQDALDLVRFKKLENSFSGLFDRVNIEWEIIEQTGLSDYHRGKSFFHGFIIIHRPLKTELSRHKELEAVFNYFENPKEFIPHEGDDPIKKQLKGVTSAIDIKVNSKHENNSAKFKAGDQALFEHIISTLKTPNDVWQNREDFWASFNLLIDQNGQVVKLDYLKEYDLEVKQAIEKVLKTTPPWTPKTINQQPVSDTLKMEIRISYAPHLKGMYLINGIPPKLGHSLTEKAKYGSSDIPYESIAIKESDVYKSLESFKNNENVALVLDVTGSMQFNIINATYWINKHKGDLPFSSFTAFNDGDKTPDIEKEIGGTKGIYTTLFIDEFQETIKTAMLAGDGGDFPENDLEAIIKAIEKDPKASQVVLIADNMSAVKDIKLLKHVKKTVSIVICALTNQVHENYLEIALKTKGKIYYQDQIIDFSSLKKGDSFKIKKSTYYFNGKKLVVD